MTSAATESHGLAAALMSAPEAVRRAFELAWASYGEGSMPVGGVLVGRTSGSIVAVGRNRTRCLRPDRRGVDGTDLAHAAIVALVDLGSGRPDIELTTTLEPCSMCAAALQVYRVGTVGYLARDPHAGVGGSEILSARRPGAGPTMRSIDEHGLGRLAGALVTDHLLRSGRHAGMLADWQSSAPGYRLGTRLFTRGRLDELARSGAPVVEVAEVADRMERRR